MARGQCPIAIILFCSFGLNFVCCLHLLCYINKSSKFRSSSASRQVMQVFNVRNFSYWKPASEIVVALSEQNISEALYFENSLFRIEQLTMLFSAQKVLYWFRVIKSKLTISSTTASVERCLSKSLLHYDEKSSEQLKLNRSSLQWFCKYSRYTVFITPPFLIDSAPQTHLCSWLSASIL